MISKLQLGLATVVVAAISAGLVWEVRENVRLHAEVESQAVAATAGTSELRKQLAALTQRATAAEADAAKLQQAMQAARTAEGRAAPRTRALTDAQERANASMARASKLAQEGKLQEALDEYLKCYRDLEGTHGMPDQQIVMSDIKRLGGTYPPATAALCDLRDAAMQKLQTRHDTRELISEIALLNERLEDGRASMALYDTLPLGDPGRQSIALIAHNSFVEARRYADALVGKSFGSMVNELDMGVRTTAGVAGPNHRSYVINGTLANIETLIGASKLEDARALTEKLFAFDGSEATHAAVKQHAERAGQPPTP